MAQRRAGKRGESRAITHRPDREEVVVTDCGTEILTKLPVQGTFITNKYWISSSWPYAVGS
jgi:hypothetical protein